MTDIKREEKLKQAAKQHGLIARKRVPPYFNASPGWMIVDQDSNVILAGVDNGRKYSLSLTQAEAFILDKEVQSHDAEQPS